MLRTIHAHSTTGLCDEQVAISREKLTDHRQYASFPITIVPVSMAMAFLEQWFYMNKGTKQVKEKIAV